MADSNFYLGREYDPLKQTVTEKEITYDPADLTTHAVVTGMTGSGKTGERRRLCSNSQRRLAARVTAAPDTSAHPPGQDK